MRTLAELIREWAISGGEKDPQVKILRDGRNCQYHYATCVGNKTYEIFLDGVEQKRLLIFCMYSAGDTVPKDRRQAVAELISRYNDGHLKIGNLELTESSNLRYRDNLKFVDQALDDKVMESMLQTGISEFKTIMPMIRQVAFSGYSPAAVMTVSNEMGELLTSRLVEEGEATSWQHFPGSEGIQRWAASVRKALSSKQPLSASDWQLIGPAIAIEHSFLRIGESIAKRIALDAGIPLHAIEAEDLPLLKENLYAFESAAPLLVYIEAGSWQNGKSSENEEDDPEARALVLNLLRAFNPEHPVLVMTIMKTIEEVAPPLRRVGAFDRWFELPPITPLAAGNLFLDLVGREHCASTLLEAPVKIGKLLDRNFDGPEGRKLAALYAQRKHIEMGRPIEFIDLVQMDSHRLMETDRTVIENDDFRERVAWHEAGHAAMALIDSNGEDAPEFTSILPYGNSSGVVVDSVEYHHASSGRRTYLDMCHSIRVSLAGRAAEEVIYGPGGITNGCRTDLANCYKLAFDAFAIWGFVPGMDEEKPSEANLAVILGSPTDSEYAYVELLVRSFLAEQYVKVRSQLQSNQSLLETIKDSLMETAILDQQEIIRIFRSQNEIEGGDPKASLKSF